MGSKGKLFDGKDRSGGWLGGTGVATTWRRVARIYFIVKSISSIPLSVADARALTPQTLTDGILSGPKPLRHRFVDDHHLP
jgi:hypothetical protein